VPGDLVELKIGDIIPADTVLCPGGHEEQVDQAALTGESLPVVKVPGDKTMMGSALKQGEAKAVVVATGNRTFFGKAASMINAVQTEGHLQKIILHITIVLLVISVVLCAVIFAKLMTATEPAGAFSDGAEDQSKFMRSLSVVVVILVASIPVAIEVVCTSTLAVGSHQLAKQKVIVARLSAIEELAGMTILCSDKTGTLTLNKLTLREPIMLRSAPPAHAEPLPVPADETGINFYAAMASKRDKGNQDAIDFCIVNSLTEEQRALMEQYKEVSFVPFNPTDKRTLATVLTPAGKTIRVSKGAPQAILRLLGDLATADMKQKTVRAIQELADRGFRALSLAVATGDDSTWQYLGILSLFDPPRLDTKDTIASAIDLGVEVKMVTGDHTLIAKETCRELGMGTNILSTEVLMDPDVPAALLDRIILEAHGFAEVMPEHKFQVVERLRQQGHVTGMTGDGVNDAPALKRADIGIAVHGATDAARAAADLVLTEEGLSVIIHAIIESRKIFQRMRNYIIYRIACTIQLLVFFFFAAVAVNLDSSYMYNEVHDRNDQRKLHATQFTLPVIALVIITILNDGCMITISHDNVMPSRRPQKWAMREVWVVALVLGFVACLSSLILLAYGAHANWRHPGDFLGKVWAGEFGKYISYLELRTIIYLKISISDFLTLFSARTRGWFWERSLGRALAIAALLATTISTLFSLFWDDIFKNTGDARMTGLRYSSTAVVATWIYCLLWFLVQDAFKVVTYWVMQKYFRSEEEKAVEEHAAAHSAAALEAHACELEASREATVLASKGLTPAHIAAAENAGVMGTIGRVMGTIGRNTVEALAPSTVSANATIGRSTLGRTAQYLPAGIDLTALAMTAAQETVRMREKTVGRAATLHKEAGAGMRLNLADLASGAAAAHHQQTTTTTETADSSEVNVNMENK
jgi:H+-transporting ATPase